MKNIQINIKHILIIKKFWWIKLFSFFITGLLKNFDKSICSPRAY